MIAEKIIEYIENINYRKFDEKSKLVIIYLVKCQLEKRLDSVSIRVCANYLKVSTSFIVRLSKYVGLSGFSALKEYIASLLVSLKFNDTPRNEDYFIKIDKSLKLAEYLTSSTIKNNKKPIFDLISALKDSSDILIYGIGDSGLVASYLSNRLNKIGVSTRGFDLITCDEANINKIKQAQMIILVSKSGETLDIITKAKIALKLGIPIYAITSNQSNTLGKLASTNIKVMFNKYNVINVEDEVLSYDSIIFSLIDSIVDLYRLFNLNHRFIQDIKN